MKEKIIQQQKSDMGFGIGEYELSERMTLKDVLEWLENNLHDWGTITIHYNDRTVLRKFDYNVCSNKQIHYHLSWELSILVKKVTFYYCFMNRDIDITLVK